MAAYIAVVQASPTARRQSERRRAHGRVPRVVQALLGVEVVAFCLSVVPGVRPEPGYVAPLDDWLQGAAYVTIAVLAWLRPLMSGVDRGIWSWFAAALTARAAAFLYYFSQLRGLDPIPYPSMSDAGWLATSVLMLGGLVALGRSRFPRLSTGLALDGVIGALAVAALMVALLYDTLLQLSAPGLSAAVVVTNLAYPVLDCVLLLMVLGTLLAFEWQAPRAVWLLGAGLVGFAVMDSVFLYQVTAGTFRPGTPLSALSLMAPAAIAFAAWVPHEWPSRTQRDLLPGLIPTTVSSLVCVGLLVYAAVAPAPLAAVLLAGAGVVVALARTFLTFRVVRSAAEYRRESRTDDLTGLPNRRAFNEALAAAVRRRAPERRLALLIVDLDNFRAVNDSLGHHYGDELLMLVAPRLQQALREDDVLARVGGDEFAVIVEDAGTELAGEVAQRLRAGLRRPFIMGPGDLQMEASVGIALFPRDGQEPAEVLRNADLAMYDAKATRSGHAFFRPEHHRASSVRLESVERLRRAIESDELVLHYQPQVSLTTGDVVGVEALVRWQHPDAGLLSPADFLPQVEGGGLMRQLTFCVLEQAARDAASWQARGVRVPVSVNLSVTNLLDVRFPEEVAMLLERAGLPGEALVLELTEDLFMTDPMRARAVISALLLKGVQLVVDDYGAGHSSLGYLRDLNGLAGLKLDRSFVTHLEVRPRSRAIVESTVALARSLGLRLVAEGVETTAVRDRLANLGCETGQGYLFSRPVPVDELSFDALEAADPWGTAASDRSG